MENRQLYCAKNFLVGSVLLTACLLAAGNAHATKGDNLIGIGPIARSMGEVGVAALQNAISAVFANPAGMCFSPYCPGSEFNFASTLFSPTIHAEVRSTALGVSVRDKSQSDPFFIPAIGLSISINPRFRFGLAAYGVSGMGGITRDKLDLFPGGNAEGEVFSQYQVMKFAPNLAYLVNDRFSIGASVHVGYAALDLGQGTSHSFGAGVQLGAIYKVAPFTFGVSYISQQGVTHERVYNFNSDLNNSGVTGDIPGEDNIQDDLDLESPINQRKNF